MANRKKAGPFSGGIFGILLAVGGFYATFFYLMPSINKASSTKHWKPTKGVITHSQVLVKHGKDKNRNNKTYLPVINYIYTHDLKKLKGNRIQWGVENLYSADESSARALVSKYAKNSKVQVFYNPKNPREAVLEQGVPLMSWVFVGVAVMFMLTGISLVFRLILAVAVVGVAGAAISKILLSSRKKVSTVPEYSGSAHHIEREASDQTLNTSRSSRYIQTKDNNFRVGSTPEIDLSDEMEDLNKVSHTSKVMGKVD